MGIIERVLMKLLRHQDIARDNGDLYLRRFFLTRKVEGEVRSWNLYLHKFFLSDLDLHLHDHPWRFTSLILAGGYWEHSVNPARLRWQAIQDMKGADATAQLELDIRFNGALHGIHLDQENLINKRFWERRQPAPPETVRTWYGPWSLLRRGARWTHRVELPAGKFCWSLVLTGAKERDWGFITPEGWCLSDKYHNGHCN